MIFIFLILLIAPLVSYGQTISSTRGAVSGGATITISGSSFGSKSPAAPLYFSNFDTDTISGVPDGWSVSAGEDYTYVDDTESWSGANSLRFEIQTGISFVQLLRDLGEHTKTIYFSTSLLIDKTGTAPDIQFKAWRYTSSPSGYYYNEEATTTSVINNFFYYNDSYWANTNTYIRYDGGSEFPVNVGSASDAMVVGEWQRVEQWVIGSSSAGASDATLGMYRVGRASALQDEDGFVSYDSDDLNYRYFMLGETWRNKDYSVSADIYYDDVYIDNTVARVEIGDTPSLIDCTHREIQLPTSWSATEISITVNQGTFIADDSAYLFVVDADGNVSDGYAITIGASESASITAPTNLAATRTP